MPNAVPPPARYQCGTTVHARNVPAPTRMTQSAAVIRSFPGDVGATAPSSGREGSESRNATEDHDDTQGEDRQRDGKNEVRGRGVDDVRGSSEQRPGRGGSRNDSKDRAAGPRVPGQAPHRGGEDGQAGQRPHKQ